MTYTKEQVRKAFERLQKTSYKDTRVRDIDPKKLLEQLEIEILYNELIHAD